MKPRGPVGACRYCGQQFMRRQSLENHEADHCPKRPSVAQAGQEAESVVAERPKWRQVNRVGGGIGWIRDEDG